MQDPHKMAARGVLPGGSHMLQHNRHLSRCLSHFPIPEPFFLLTLGPEPFFVSQKAIPEAFKPWH